MKLTQSQGWILGLTILSVILFQTGCNQWISGSFAELPAHFEGDRIFVRPVTVDGETLNLFTDTGGGLVLISDVVDRLNLPTETITTDDRTVTVAELPEFKAEASIPPVPALPNAPVTKQGHFPVAPADQAPDYFGDGVLGQFWFARRVWTFDYSQEKLWFTAAEDPSTYDAAHTVPIYFKTNAEGEPVSYFPRIQAEVDGETLDFLLDTGATVVLSEQAQVALDDGEPRIRATSYIIRSIFDEWREQHPDWRLLEQADEVGDGDSMIEVPEVIIADHTVGPVWFTRRDDSNFLDFISQSTDQTVVGALGGSLFQYFQMTINYPEELAHFKRLQ